LNADLAFLGRDRVHLFDHDTLPGTLRRRGNERQHQAGAGQNDLRQRSHQTLFP